MFMTSQGQIELLINQWKYDHFETLFCWKYRNSNSKYGIVCFLKKKITLKDFKKGQIFNLIVRLASKWNAKEKDA